MPRRSAASKAQGLRRLAFHYMKDATGRYAPIVYLQAWTGNRWLYLQAYVDSGASWSVFHLDVAQLLGIKFRQAKRRYVSLGNGAVLPIYYQKIRIRFAGQEFLAPVGFSDALHMRFNLMGRAGFFDRFLMTFNDRARTLIVTPVSNA